MVVISVVVSFGGCAVVSLVEIGVARGSERAAAGAVVGRLRRRRDHVLAGRAQSKSEHPADWP